MKIVSENWDYFIGDRTFSLLVMYEYCLFRFEHRNECDAICENGFNNEN